jgi:hypothetical protein
MESVYLRVYEHFFFSGVKVVSETLYVTAQNLRQVRARPGDLGNQHHLLDHLDHENPLLRGVQDYPVHPI